MIHSFKPHMAMLVDEAIKLSFFGAISFGRAGEPEMTDDDVLEVASLDDLMATKVKVILQRIEVRDYRDIAAMLRAGASLERGLAIAREMYGSALQPSESLKAMVYFKGGDLNATLTRSKRETLVDAVSATGDLPKIEIKALELAIPRGAA